MSWCRLSNKRQSGIIPTTKHTPRMFMGQEVPEGATHYVTHPDGVLCGIMNTTPGEHTGLGFIQYSLDGRAYVCVNGTIFSSQWAPIYMTRFSDYNDRIKPLPNQESNNQQEKNMKEFTKADLRSGFTVRTRSGNMWIVVLGRLYNDGVILSGTTSTHIECFTDNLLSTISTRHDIVEVYHPGDWKESFGHIPAQSSRLIWKREEKSPEQLAYEALQQKIAEHEQTMKELKEQAEKLKPKG